ncbi:MAG: AAA family ATPase, partial [Polynucleobacter sp.]|nr:AAA family ATPase [Polynucleobacter sp.]
LKLQLIDEVWDLSQEEVWDKNPGGIAGVVLSRLPTYLLVPAEYSANEIDSKSGVLQKTLNELFKDVRANSKHYQVAQSSLNELAKELDPSDGGSEFGKMMTELNGVLSGVFPDSKILASADLSNPDSALVPSFEIQMSSNIRSSVAHQGTGMVRAAVFGLLRFRQQWVKQRAKDDRGLIIGFEEPEIYLHPSAANQMRDIIYELSGKSSQIVATTHSPYLIDLARKPRQVLNRFYYDSAHTTIHPFSVSDEFSKLQADDKDQVKMLLRLDDHASRIFFTRKVIVVEGDTEELVLKEAIRRMDAAKRAAIQSRTEILKARGKASIIGLLKYLSALGVNFFVIHDRDQGTPGAEVFNEPIGVAAGSPNNVAMIQECIEDLLGYAAPSSEKPYKAYKQTLQWGDDWDGVPTALKALMARAYEPYI